MHPALTEYTFKSPWMPGPNANASFPPGQTNKKREEEWGIRGGMSISKTDLQFVLMYPMHQKAIIIIFIIFIMTIFFAVSCHSLHILHSSFPFLDRSFTALL
jgi:hypothetical protein